MYVCATRGVPRCILQALSKHPDNRPSAAELLQHPWLSPEAPPKGVTRQASNDAVDTIAAVRSPVVRAHAGRDKAPPRCASSPNLLARNTLATPPASKQPAPRSDAVTYCVAALC